MFHSHNWIGKSWYNTLLSSANVVFSAAIGSKPLLKIAILFYTMTSRTLVLYAYIIATFFESRIRLTTWNNSVVHTLGTPI